MNTASRQALATSPAGRPGADDATAADRLSVVFVVRGRLANLRKALDCLLAQTAAERIELLVSADSAALGREVGDHVSAGNRFASIRVLVHARSTIARGRRLAAMEATGTAVAIVEDHGFPEPGWAEELLAAFVSSPDVLAAAPLMRNPHDGSAVSRAQFLLFHGAGPPRSAVERFVDQEALPWHSTAYRRGPLAAATRDDGTFEAEIFLQEGMRTAHPDGRFVRCQRASLDHVNMSRLLPALGLAFHSGRVFGDERSRRRGWRAWHRIARATLFPLVALLKIRRSSPVLCDGSSLGRTLANFATAVPIAACHAAGEAVGTCFGKGRSPEAFSDFEVDRIRFQRPADRHLLLADTGRPGQASSPPSRDTAHGPTPGTSA